MQIAVETTTSQSLPGATLSESSATVQPSQYSPYKDIRHSAVVGFEPSEISVAMTTAFLAVNGGQRNFLGTRLIEYQTGGALRWD